ncbi:sugar O-acetyltransferase [Kitasatospora sp. NBC_01302]|uniref:sugar O-acetyltransferase n=1 Tax=Kitasatospora sp. NBC_01302 TaxID=2903575 RepID=UPI002E120DF3|nr:sugar O-acetyltransferase [Kitasatospora sp. NBC_01302]
MGEMKDRMLAGDWFIADDPELGEAVMRCAKLLAAFNAIEVPAPAERRAILEQLFGAMGEGVIVRPPFRCDVGWNIGIGARSFVNFGGIFLDTAPITIGADVQIGPNVQLLAPHHELDTERRRAGWEKALPITIGDNVWLGGGVIVCPGVTIGENTVVGAGSVVTKDLPAGVLAVGNPARVIRELD